VRPALRNAAAALGGGLVVIVTPYLWVAGASNIYCAGIGRLDLFVFPFTQWLIVAPYWRMNWWVTLWVVVAAAAPTFVLGLCAFAAKRRFSNARLIYGKTDWATRSQMKAGNISTRKRPF
jgi:hypothetical protein